MGSKRPNQELFKDEDRTLRFIADFGFLLAFEKKHSLWDSYVTLAEGGLPVEVIRDVLVNSINDIDGREIPDGGKEKFIEEMITRQGIQSCAIAARVMLTHAMIGDTKKSHLEKAQQIMDMLSPSLISWRVGLLWAGNVVISTFLACMIFKLLNLCG